ncbi:unnamed protein product, partial [Mesorhabditis belari]|uniref:Uncharacterized protein n=1 Tax=Mesorhabditis belari TaxID=2138241 RepID=A0AAF3EU14_9BILA
MGNKSSSYDVQQQKEQNQNGKIRKVHDSTSTDKVVQKENTEPSAPSMTSPSAPPISSPTPPPNEFPVDVPTPRGSLTSATSSQPVFTSQIEYNVQPVAELATDFEDFQEPPVQQLFRVRPLPESPLDKEPTEDCYD